MRTGNDEGGAGRKGGGGVRSDSGVDISGSMKSWYQSSPISCFSAISTSSQAMTTLEGVYNTGCYV